MARLGSKSSFSCVFPPVPGRLNGRPIVHFNHNLAEDWMSDDWETQRSD
jgi:hypothetical protein